LRSSGDGLPCLPLLAHRCALASGANRGGPRHVSRCPQPPQFVRPAVRGRASTDRLAVGHLSTDLFDGRAYLERNAAVAKLGGSLLARIFIISNRVANPAPSKDSVHAGGLEVALRATLKRHSCVWLGWSGEVKPKGKARTQTIRQNNITYIVTDLTREDYEEYYNGFANRVLWPILHYRLDLAEFTRRDLTGYLRVNEHFASELDRVVRTDDVIWVHDYHLMPLAKALRARGHQNRIGFFL